MASLLGADKLLDKMYPSGFMTLVDYVAKVTRVDLLSSLKRLDEEKVCDRACAGEIEGIFVATTSADIELAFGDVDSLPNAFSLENHSTLKELVMHALSCLCHKANRSNEMYQQRNVLSLGYGLRSNPDNANVVDAPFAKFLPQHIGQRSSNASVGEGANLHRRRAYVALVDQLFYFYKTG